MNAVNPEVCPGCSLENMQSDFGFALGWRDSPANLSGDPYNMAAEKNTALSCLSARKRGACKQVEQLTTEEGTVKAQNLAGVIVNHPDDRGDLERQLYAMPRESLILAVAQSLADNQELEVAQRIERSRAKSVLLAALRPEEVPIAGALSVEISINKGE